MSTLANRAERRRQRRLDHLIRTRIETDGDHCSICRRPLVDRDLTHYGIAFGEVMLTGDCCAAKLDPQLAAGIYIAPRRRLQS